MRGPLFAANTGRHHNQRVAEALIRIGELVGADTSVDRLYDVAATVVADERAARGWDRTEAEALAKAQAALWLEGHLDEPRFAAVYQRYLAEPSVAAAVADERARTSTAPNALRSRRIARSGSGQGLQVTNAATLEEAAYDVIDVGSADYRAAAIVLARTDTVAGAHAANFNSATQDTLFAVEEITDSSRAFWEAFALQAWIDSNGDSTIFDPRVGGVARCQEPSAPLQSLALVDECPNCPAAAGTAVLADVVTGFLQIRGGRRGWDLAGDVAGASVMTGIGTLMMTGTGNPGPSFLQRARDWLGSFIA